MMPKSASEGSDVTAKDCHLAIFTQERCVLTALRLNQHNAGNEACPGTVQYPTREIVQGGHMQNDSLTSKLTGIALKCRLIK